MTSTKQRNNTYHQLSSLSNSLWNESKVTARRSLSQQILEIISNARMRQRLKRECESNEDALFKIWRLIVKSSLHASEKCLDQSTNGKTRKRLIKEDITLPFKVLTYCDDQITSNLIQKENGTFSPVDEPFTFESFYRYRGSQLHLTKMGSREILSLLNLCLNCLATDEALEVAENEMLDYLNLLCSRSDYVVHFHPYRQVIENIMEELQPRILSQKGGSRENEISIKSSRVFCSLIQQCAWNLGLSMHAFIRPCINMVADWCRDHVSSSLQAHLPMISHLYNAVTNLIAHNPEQSIVIMSQSGHFLLNIAKKCFPFSRGVEKQVLLDYFSSHLLLCEVAGKIQGLWADDLGDIGLASLDCTQIEFLLQLFLSERELEKLHEQKDELRSRKNDRNLKFDFRPLTKLEMRYFELCARLLRYAQRYFLARTEIQSYEPDEKNDRSSAVLDEFEKCGKDYDGLGATTSNNIHDSILRTSPWVRFVSKCIEVRQKSMVTTSSSHMAKTNGNEYKEKRIGNESPSGYEPEHSDDKRNLSLNGPKDVIIVEENIDSNHQVGNCKISETMIVQYLQLISACAEAFPRGDIWSSTNQWKRKLNVTFQCPSDVRDRNSDLPYCNVASLDDTASVLRLVCRLLESHGGATGNQLVQMWSLICLLKLTESSCMICRHWSVKENSSSFSLLAKTWRGVWDTLFRSDLRYSACTKNAKSSSIGEMVLMLLTEIIRNRCTDPIIIKKIFDHTVRDQKNKKTNEIRFVEPKSMADPSTFPTSFLFSRQDQVWSLPIFKSPSLIRISSPFELASVLIQSAGLSEGIDSIISVEGFEDENSDAVEDFSEFINPEALKQNMRRYRLSCFCIQFIRLSIYHDKLQLLRTLLPFVSSCFVSLLGGHSITFTSTFTLESFRKYRCTIDSEAPCEVTSQHYKHNTGSSELDLEVLWRDSILPFHGQYSVDKNEKMWRLLQHRDCRLFFPTCLEDRYWAQLLQKNTHSINCDHVPSPIMKEFRKLAFKSLEKTIIHGNMMSKSENEISKQTDSCKMFQTILVVKFCFCLEVFHLEYNVSEETVEMTNTSIKHMLVDIPRCLNPDISRTIEFSWFIADLIGLFRSIKNISIHKGNGYIRKICEDNFLSKLVSACEILIKDYATSDKGSKEYIESSMVNTKSVESDEDVESFSDGAFLSDDDLANNNTYEGETVHFKRKRLNSNFLSSKRPKLMKILDNEHTLKASQTKTEIDKLISTSLNAWLCAKLLVVIDSSLDQIINMTNYLSWSYENYQDNYSLRSYPEPHNSILCLDTLLSSCVENERINDESTLTIMTRIILTGRSEAAISTPYILLGFYTCALIMKTIDIQSDLQSQEYEDLLQIIHPEGYTDLSRSHQKLICRALKTRPYLRSIQIESATNCFRDASSAFHDEFDHIFSHYFVVSVIVDNSNFHVRYCAQKALQAAIENLSSQKVIVDELLEILPQVWSYSTYDEAKMCMNYQNWVKNELSKQNELLNENSIEHKSWLDSRLSYEYHTIQCIGTLGSYTSDPEISLDMVFKLINMTHGSCKFLGLCFPWLEQISFRLGFRSLESMWYEEQEWFLQKWILCRNRLVDIPIIISSPALFRCIMRLNKIGDLIQKSSSVSRQASLDETIHVDYMESTSYDLNFSTLSLQDDGLCEFMMKVAQSAIAIFLMIPMKFPPADLNKNCVTADLEKVRWQYLVEITHILTGEAEDAVSRVLKSHLHDIFAFLIPFLQSTLPEDSSLAIEESKFDCLLFLKSIISDELISRELRKKSFLAVHKIIKLSGKRMHLFGVSIRKSSCIHAIRYIGNKLSCKKTPSTKNKSLFHIAGTSAVESILHAQRDLYESQSESQKRNSLKAIDFICDIVSKDSYENDSTYYFQLCFCINALLTISLNSDYGSFHFPILTTLKSMLDCLANLKCLDDKKEETSSVLHKFFTTIFQIHDQALGSFISTCLSKKMEHSIRKRITNGLIKNTANEHSFGGILNLIRIQHENLLNTSFGDNQNKDDMELEKAIHSYHNFVDDDTKKTLIICYDLLDLVLNKQLKIFGRVFQSLDLSLPGQFTNEKIRIVEKINRKFSLASLFQKYEEIKSSITKTDLENDLRTFSSLIKRLRFNNFIERSNTMTNVGLHPEAFSQKVDQNICQATQRSLLGAIIKLRKTLNSHDFSLPSSKVTLRVFEVMEDLFHLSTNRDPKIVTEISRCFGKLSKIDLCGLSPLDVNDPSEHHTKDDFFENPSLWFKARIFELVAYFIQSEDIDTAILAKDTAKALMKNKDVLDMLKTTQSDKSKQLLLALYSHTTDNKTLPISVSDEYIEKLKSDAHDASNDLAENEWCWSEQIWSRLDGKYDSYEDWIKNVVCSIIVCHFGNSSSGHFYSLCAKLCQQEYTFASYVFPAIIHDLIESDKTDILSMEQFRLSTKRSSFKEEDIISNNAVIGSKFSRTNQLVTKCFSKVLQSDYVPEEYTKSTFIEYSSDKDKNDGRRGEMRRLDLIIPVINMFRSITSKRFLSSKLHKPNPRKLNTRKYPFQSMTERTTRVVDMNSKKIPDKLYNKNLGHSPIWRGVPYGVVLHLNGLELATACLRTKLYLSSLFYIEMYADNQFCGSGGVLDRLSQFDMIKNGSFQPLSMSGCGVLSNINAQPDMHCASLDDAKLFQCSLQSIYSKLMENENVKGTEQFSNITNFQLNDLAHGGNHVRHKRFQKSDQFQSLVDKDIDLQKVSHISCERKKGLPEDSRSMVVALNNMGLRHISQRYMASFKYSQCEFSTSDQMWLNEEWSEQAWRLSQWDDSVFHAGLTSTYLDNGSKFPKSGKCGLQEAVRSSFSCIIKEDAESFDRWLRLGRENLLQDMNENICVECLLNGMPDYIVKLRALNEIEQLGMVYFQNLPVHQLLQKWELVPNIENNVISQIKNASFSTMEFFMSVREVALKTLCQKYGHGEDIGTGLALSLHLMSFCKFARQGGRPNIAEAALIRLCQFQDHCKVHKEDLTEKAENSIRIHLEETKIIKCRGNDTEAIRNLKLLITSVRQFLCSNDKMDSYTGEILLSECLLLCGQWLINHKLDSGTTILNDYLKPSVDVLSSYDPNKENGLFLKRSSLSNFALGDFTSNLFETVCKRMSSQDWKKTAKAASDRVEELHRSKAMLDEIKKEIESLKKKSPNARKKKDMPQNNMALKKKYDEVYIHVLTLEKEVQRDKKERLLVEQSAVRYLHTSLSAFGAALSRSDTKSQYIKHVYRMVSLWFNAQIINNECDANTLIRDLCDGIPSFWFVRLTYQIFSRIDTSNVQNKDFQRTLQWLVLKICKEHPYHSIVQLIALSNGKKIGSGVSGRHASMYLDNVGATKVEAACDLLKSLRKNGPEYVSGLVNSYETLIDGYIQLAMAPTDKMIKKNLDIKKIDFSQIGASFGVKHQLNQCISSGRNYPFPPCVLTKPPLLQPSGDYGHGLDDPSGSERVAGFHSSFSLTETGVHRPKIVVCKGSKGGSFKQVVKGEDDIRQDAVMEQVFTTLNSLLKLRSDNDKIFAKHLKVVTYNILPLSPASGVLEWVDGTIPIGDYLTDKGTKVGAHSKYYPGEWGNHLCRLHHQNAPVDRKREAFDEICKNFSPVFRFFFHERFSYSLQAWHAARTNYVTSCAVSSIVGHVLGIGDRHSHNILIHQRTGEVVHIDFGIVFEQGKCLTVPETVPFRLTRDMVDGLGPLGTEGTFVYAAEATMNVLRENSGTILSVLSAVVSDPLYKWCISPVAARRRQRDDEDQDIIQEEGTLLINDDVSNIVLGNENDAAILALGKVREKLQGYEEGLSGERQSVEGQVRFLINSATDKDNLCALFSGWAPWL